MPLSSHMTCTAQIRPVAAGGAAFPPQAGRRLPPALVLYCNYQRNNHSPARPPSPLMAGFPVTMQRPAQAAVEQSNVTRQRVLVKSVGVMQPRETGRPAIRGGCKGETGAAGNRERGGRQRKQKRRWGGRGGRASVEPGTLPPKPQPAIAGGQTKKAAIRAYRTWPLPAVTGQYNCPASCAQQRYSGGCGGSGDCLRVWRACSGHPLGIAPAAASRGAHTCCCQFTLPPSSSSSSSFPPCPPLPPAPPPLPRPPSASCTQARTKGQGWRPGPVVGSASRPSAPAKCALRKTAAKRAHLSFFSFFSFLLFLPSGAGSPSPAASPSVLITS